MLLSGSPSVMVKDRQARLEDDPSGFTAEKQMGRKTSTTKTHAWYQHEFVFGTIL